MVLLHSIVYSIFCIAILFEDWFHLVYLKIQPYKLHTNKYMIASTQIANPEIFAFIAVLVFHLSSHKVLFINRKDNRNC